MTELIQKLLDSDEPSIRYKIRVNVFGESTESESIRSLREEIRQSRRVRALLGNRDDTGRIQPVHHVYKKWTGAHWVLASLADIGYPEADPDLIPIRNQVLDCWLDPSYMTERICAEAPPSSRDSGVSVINGRARRCASQQSNALFSIVKLGLIDDRCHELARLLIEWQWPDGGWNCDRRPDASTSSFWETLIPLRGLSAYVQATGDEAARDAAHRTAEFFLKRRLFKRMSDGNVMNPQFIRLHYPCFWRYDILFALKVMVEAGFISDPRCADALDLLESLQLSNGGWPAHERFYNTRADAGSGSDLVSWGVTSKTKMNEWVSADALNVLKAANRV
ncbi:MAG: hypothetical protein ACYC0V_08930 [Armatimonadota bacterium]